MNGRINIQKQGLRAAFEYPYCITAKSVCVAASGVNAQQEDIAVKDRFYFFVADRKLQKSFSILDVIQKNQQNALNDIIQAHYQQWIDKQSTEVKNRCRKKAVLGTG